MFNVVTYIFTVFCFLLLISWAKVALLTCFCLFWLRGVWFGKQKIQGNWNWHFWRSHFSGWLPQPAAVKHGSFLFSFIKEISFSFAVFRGRCFTPILPFCDFGCGTLLGTAKATGKSCRNYWFLAHWKPCCCGPSWDGMFTHTIFRIHNHFEMLNSEHN